MFTGIVEETGRVTDVHRSGQGIQLHWTAVRTAKSLKTGDSLAVNGCCLTVVEVRRHKTHARIRADLLEETWRLTNLQFLQPGSLVNLERPLSAHARLDGHFVTGHIDGIGRIRRWEQHGADGLLEIDAPASVRRYIVLKGSIAVDGISLTVAASTRTGFQVWIIPHTRAVTNLSQRQPGDRVNLEADLLGKYVDRLLAHRSRRKAKRSRSA